jgi:hypothetical protein
MNVDPSAALVMKLSSELMEQAALIRRQRRRIALLAAALHAERHASNALAEVLELMLEDERHA